MHDFWEEERQRSRLLGRLDSLTLRSLYEEDPVRKMLKDWEREDSRLANVAGLTCTVTEAARQYEEKRRLAFHQSVTENVLGSDLALLERHRAPTIAIATTQTYQTAIDSVGAYSLASMEQYERSIAAATGAIAVLEDVPKPRTILGDQLRSIVGDLASGHDQIALRYGSVPASAIIATALDDQFAVLTAGQELARQALNERAQASVWPDMADYTTFRQASVAELETFAARASSEDLFLGRAFGDAAALASLTTRMADMDRAWLNPSDSMASVRAFARVQAVADVLREAPPFASAVGSWLRTAGFGDWRDPIDLRSTLGIAILEGRPDVYSRQGADEDIEHTPLPVFAKSADIGGLFDIDADWEEEWIVESDVDAQLSLQAYARLRNFELAMRTFIRRSLSAISNKWEKQRLPQDIYNNWKEKEEKDLKASGQSSELISYADFTDYIKIIERKDNWNEVFQPVFRRQEDIRECMQRLYPLRLATMHARKINAMDLHNLLHETQRMMRVISKKSRNR